MSRESFVFILGLLVFLVPLLGIPRDAKEIIFIVAGAVLMVVGLSLRRSAFVRSIEHVGGERKSAEFTESVVITREHLEESKQEIA